MALKKLEASLDIISELGTNPGSDNDLNEEQLKAKFDEAANIIKDYLNNYLLGELDKTVDVEALLSDILDVTLSKKNKAANSAATGDAIRSLRSFFDKVVHGGDYVLKSEGTFSAEIPAALTVHIDSGAGVMQGNLFDLPEKTLQLGVGTYGLKRHDLIVVRCNREEDNTLNYSYAVLSGSNTSGNPIDPDYRKEDINANGTVREFPLYRVVFEGTDIASISPLFYAENTINNRIKAEPVYKTLLYSGWSESAPYKQTIEADVTKEDTPHVGMVPNEDVEIAMAQEEAWACVSRGVTADGSITFTCYEDKPEVDINLMIEVNH